MNGWNKSGSIEAFIIIEYNSKYTKRPAMNDKQVVFYA